MKIVKLQDILEGKGGLDAYLTYRDMDDWCQSHIPVKKWRFDYSTTICVHGVDIPGRIFFWKEEDATAFMLRHKKDTSEVT